MNVSHVQPAKANYWDSHQGNMQRDPQQKKTLSETKRPVDAMGENVQAKIQEAIQTLNESTLLGGRRLQFDIHEDTGRTMVRVVDRETDEVIREIPPEEVLDVVARINEMLGLLVDERA